MDPDTTTQAGRLAAIDASLKSIVSGYEAMQERVKSIQKDREDIAAVEARLLALDNGLKDVSGWRNDVELRMASVRGGLSTERDAVLQLMTPQEKSLINRVRGFRVGDVVASDDTGVLRRTRGMHTIAQRDPVGYVACGLLMQAHLKAAKATRASRPEEVARWMERADKLTEALGGIAPEAKVALQEDTNSEGGFLVPTIVENMIGWLMKEASVVRRSGATVMQMTSKSHQLPSLANDFTVNWTTEEGTIVDSVPASPFSGGQLVAKKQTGLVTISLELAQDNVTGLMDFILAHLLQQLGRAEDAQALEGDGTVFTGLFSAAGLASVAGGSNALSEDELRKLIYGGEHEATMDGSVIWCHPWIVRDAMGLTTSNAIWFPYLLGMNSQTPTPRNIWGVPTFPTSSILRNRGGGTNETTAYHGDPSYLVIGDRAGVQFDLNPWSETEFKKGQVLLRVIRRVGILVWVPAYFTKLTAVTVS